MSSARSRASGRVRQRLMAAATSGASPLLPAADVDAPPSGVCRELPAQPKHVAGRCVHRVTAGQVWALHVPQDKLPCAQVKTDGRAQQGANFYQTIHDEGTAQHLLRGSGSFVVHQAGGLAGWRAATAAHPPLPPLALLPVLPVPAASPSPCTSSPSPTAVMSPCPVHPSAFKMCCSAAAISSASSSPARP